MRKFLLAAAAFGALAACAAAATPSQSAPAAPVEAHLNDADLNAAVARAVAEASVAPDTARIAPTSYNDDAGPDDISCRIFTRRTSHGLLVEGQVRADRDMDGEYQIVIHQSGANSSDITQGGAFSIAAGEEQSLGQSEFSLSRGSDVAATLILSDAGGELCRDDL